MIFVFFFNDPAATGIYTLSLHDALPIFVARALHLGPALRRLFLRNGARHTACGRHGMQEPEGYDERQRSAHPIRGHARSRSEEHTSELQSRQYLVCRLLLEKKKNNIL